LHGSSHLGAEMCQDPAHTGSSPAVSLSRLLPYFTSDLDLSECCKSVDQGIVFEKAQSARDRIVYVLRVDYLRIVERMRSVVPDPTKMPE
jgi:hypothetical protein